jgi:hypothetical protein
MSASSARRARRATRDAQRWHEFITARRSDAVGSSHDPTSACQVGLAAEAFVLSIEEARRINALYERHGFHPAWRYPGEFASKWAGVDAFGRTLLVLSRDRHGVLQVDYFRRTRALAYGTRRARIAFIEAVKKHPDAAARSAMVRAARGAFAAAMIQARECDASPLVRAAGGVGHA